MILLWFHNRNKTFAQFDLRSLGKIFRHLGMHHRLFQIETNLAEQRHHNQTKPYQIWNHPFIYWQWNKFFIEQIQVGSKIWKFIIFIQHRIIRKNLSDIYIINTGENSQNLKTLTRNFTHLANDAYMNHLNSLNVL